MRRNLFKRIALASVPLFLASGVALQAQSDNFDSGTLDSAWKKSNFNPALVNNSFRDVGTGKALRLQANPVPGTAPAASMLFRDEIYTNFYMSVDLVDWPGIDKDQALVLLARGNLSANPATTTAIILNYDASQDGESATSRRHGEFQINMVTNDPPFGTKTLASAQVTFQPGRSYRLIFKGEGSHYTGTAYDLEDLSRPVITIQADDAIQGTQGGGIQFENGFVSGKSGLLVFSRDGTSGTADFTIDNYYVAATDPNPAGPALPHAVAGTPVVASRTPGERFKNFHNPADGLSFEVKTYTDNFVNASATKLRLNGNDVSSQLVLPANSSNVTIRLPGSSLAANTVYSAQLELQDVSGTKKSTNTFWFDTFSDAYLKSAGVKVIEAEEYNFNGGDFKTDPITPSGYNTAGDAVNQDGAGFLELVGFEGIDFHDARTSPESDWGAEFRSQDAVGLSGGMFAEIEDVGQNEADGTLVRYSDNIRAQHAALNLPEYVVHRTEPGEWLNYTRTFDAGTYVPYLRVASYGATEVELQQVTSDRTQENQQTSKLGTFKVPNMLARFNYRYLPLVNDAGQPATVTLPAGTNTLRLQMAGTPGQDARKIAINYLLLVPQPAGGTVRLFAANLVAGPYSEATGATIDSAARRITIPVTGSSRFFQIKSGSAVHIHHAMVSGNTLMLDYE